MRPKKTVVLIALFGVHLACGQAADARPGFTPYGAPTSFAMIPVPAPGLAVMPVSHPVTNLPPMVVREQCLVDVDREERPRGYGMSGSGTGGGGAYGTVTASGSGSGSGYGGGAVTRGKAAPPPMASPAPDMSQVQGVAEASNSAGDAVAAGGLGYGPQGGANLGSGGLLGGAGGPGGVGGGGAAQPPQVAGNSPARATVGGRDDNSRPAAPVAELDDGPARRGGWLQTPAPGPRVDWGGTIYLSNDDAMSLASAQRLLYALDRGAGFTLDQIRPHELLNYFTFDASPASGGEMFGVHASAEQKDRDSLSLALTVQGATPPRAALDLTLLVDRSGSMSAEGRMDYTHRALQIATSRLQQGDRVDLVVFDHEACTPLENFVVGRDDIGVLRRLIDEMQPRGSTDLDLGLHTAYGVALSHTEADRAGRVMVFTDAQLNTGDVNPNTVSEIGRALDSRNIRLTGVGVGSDFRDDVLNKITEKGKGAYVFLGSERVVDRLFDRGFDSLVQTIAHDVHFSLTLPPSLGMEKFYGEESSRTEVDVQPVNFQAGATQVFLEDLAVRDGVLDPNAPITFNARWVDPVTGAARAQTWNGTIGSALRSDPHDVRKAMALIKWTDVLVAHTMGNDACGAAFQDYRRAIGGLQGDAEIAYTSELLGKWCDFSTPVATWTAPARTRIRIDADQPITEVAMSCSGGTERHALGLAENIATFNSGSGTCDVTLYGTVPMTARLQVSPTGEDLRCVIRGGRMSCG